MCNFPYDSLSRARRAGDAVVAAGGSQMEAALTMIAVGFDRTSEVQAFKDRVRWVIALGAGHEKVRARYGYRMRKLRERLNVWRDTNSFAASCAGIPECPEVYCDIAILITERWYREERNPLSLRCLRELRLILRLLRHSKERGHVLGLLDFGLGSQLEAAE